MTVPLLLSLLATAGQTLQPLFVLGRSKNANVVVYSVRLKADGSPDPKRPVEAHWLMKAEDGREEPLSELERKLAYGFNVKALAPGEWTVALKAVPSRPFTLMKLSGGWRAVLRLSGQPSELQRIFVTEKDELDVPEVQSAELWGVSLADGSAAHEILRPSAMQPRPRRRRDDAW
ncbi:MAG: DUF4833 domain-containing protein [Myxococcales bacterium]